MDFVHDRLATGPGPRILTVVDTFSRFWSAVVPRFGFRAPDVDPRRPGQRVHLARLRPVDIYPRYHAGLRRAGQGTPELVEGATDDAFIESSDGLPRRRPGASSGRSA